MVLHRGAGSDAGRALDGGGVHATMHDAPRCVVIRSEIDVPADPRAAYLFEDEPGGGNEGAGLLEGAGLQGWRSRCGGLSRHDDPPVDGAPKMRQPEVERAYRPSFRPEMGPDAVSTLGP